ncbi:hypothetical protein AAZX31_07G126700 [Glycine max]|uniref:Knottin scorpion toxin-like domain-containing protein n=1 Tax=Glycine max TaxID=3847 RepID=K7L1H6_SOYBN|nr:hypothetical protein JHK87_018337 [Glycine soja]KAG5022547.1 hypothetical protein JHK85_018889 [Glycine max]KAG5037641.1 hypothetical protein JHK86_018481 [Glycine max]KAH1086724.1 hypothetical protein GYH30_018291 [Glycine max]KRH49129.1 hypothetical protein GLYMA_07G134200v4 [Glycine max]
MARTLVSVISLIFFTFAVMVVVLFSIGVNSSQICPGNCENFSNCNAYCQAHYHKKGICISPPKRGYICCCFS